MTRRKILIVDDDTEVREVVAAVVGDAGYQVLEACDGLEALEVLDDHPDICLMVSDIMMPNMTGTELADVVRIRFPAMKIILISGFATSVTLDYRLLQKPFRLAALLVAISEELAHGLSNGLLIE